MARYRREVVVPTPLAMTFAYLSRFSSAEEWDPGVIRAQMVTPEPVGVGSRFSLVAVFLGLAALSLSFLPAAFLWFLAAAAVIWVGGLALWFVAMWKAASGDAFRIPLAADWADKLNRE